MLAAVLLPLLVCMYLRHKDPALLQQVMQGLPFLSFVGENSSVQQEPMAWLKAGELTLGAWRAAEEDLQALSGQAAAAVKPAGPCAVSRARQNLHLADTHDDGFAGGL